MGREDGREDADGREDTVGDSWVVTTRSLLVLHTGSGFTGSSVSMAVTVGSMVAGERVGG